MSVSLTVSTGGDDDATGYLLVRVDGADSPNGRARYVSVHRLAALAWGELPALDAPLHVHHVDGAPCHNATDNLLAVPADDHGELTAEQVSERRGRA